jgi:hypothetical protein
VHYQENDFEKVIASVGLKKINYSFKYLSVYSGPGPVLSLWDSKENNPKPCSHGAPIVV